VAGPWPWAPPSIRHWWQQQQQKQQKRSTSEQQHHSGSSISAAESSSPLPSHCLQRGKGIERIHALTINGSKEYSEQVCNARTLDQRVRVLLEASPCKQHRLCQVLSPEDLRSIASDFHACKHTVLHKWWVRFKHIEDILVDFDDVLSEKFSIGGFSVVYDVEQCRVRQSSLT
jgi:hypothetical protein